jgi:hypothetical protein
MRALIADVAQQRTELRREFGYQARASVSGPGGPLPAKDRG